MGFIFDPSLVLYLPLYELDGSSFMSRDAYGHLCTVTGAVWRPNGHYFDGTDDEVSIGTGSDALDITGAITLLAWMKDTDVVNKGWIMGKMGTAAGGYSLYVGSGSTRKVSLGLDTGAWAAHFSDDAVATGVWAFVGGTYDLSNVRLYINGALAGTVEETGAIASRAKPLVLGDEEGWDSQTFGGLIGEVWVYNRALTPLEIQHNYLATKWRYR